jgi:nitroreductase
MKKTIHYFEDVRADNTAEVLALIRDAAKSYGISKVVLASTTGKVASRALDFFQDEDVELIVVPHQYDFSAKDANRFPQDLSETLRRSGHKVHFGTMLFHTDKLYGSGEPTAIANFLRTFGEGVKVCVEISLMAADAGLVSQDERVIVAAGTGWGLDTALVIQSGSTQNLNKLKINEILCKPLNLRDGAAAVADEEEAADEARAASPVSLSTLEAIFTRRSVRDFEDREVEDEKRRILFQAAAAAPSAHGKQPWKFAEMSDRSIIKKIIEKFPWFAPASKTGFNILVLGEPAKCANREYWVVDCAAATENILLAAQALGLGGVWMGIAPVEENIANFKSVVAIPDGLVPFSLIAIGYPKEGARPPKRAVNAEKFMIEVQQLVE